jgi:hypothetical protein
MATARWSGDRSSHGTTFVPPITTVQGKPVARRGRKARDLRKKTAQLPGMNGKR